MYEKRTYREMAPASGLTKFVVREFETDLLVLAESNLENEARDSVHSVRKVLTEYIEKHRAFGESFEPVMVLADAPPIAAAMGRAGYAAGVGPMAAVAGAIAEVVARDLAVHSSEVIVENGGDIYIVGRTPRTISLHAGKSPLSGKVGLRLPPAPEGMAVCTSSGTVGHSTSFGIADAAVVVAHDGALADAAATATGNRVKSADDIEPALQFAMSVPGVAGVLIVVGEKMGALGEIELAGL
jgi:ApbE superfamily uncharacterized protein (UPF0280 family)